LWALANGAENGCKDRSWPDRAVLRGKMIGAGAFARLCRLLGIGHGFGPFIPLKSKASGFPFKLAGKKALSGRILGYSVNLD
jgi:hypothetical protein